MLLLASALDRLVQAIIDFTYRLLGYYACRFIHFHICRHTRTAYGRWELGKLRVLWIHAIR